LKFADPTSIGLPDPVVVAGYMLGQKTIAMPGSTTMRYGPLRRAAQISSASPRRCGQLGEGCTRIYQGLAPYSS
jgi:hypothetical protein